MYIVQKHEFLSADGGVFKEMKRSKKVGCYLCSDVYKQNIFNDGFIKTKHSGSKSNIFYERYIKIKHSGCEECHRNIRMILTVKCIEISQEILSRLKILFLENQQFKSVHWKLKLGNETSILPTKAE